MKAKAAQLKRFMEHLQDALTASALAEENEGEAALDLRAGRGSPAASAIRGAQLRAVSTSGRSPSAAPPPARGGRAV